MRREMEVWKKLRHPNVLPFIGMFSVGHSTYLISPWMHNGDALGYVKRNPNADVVDLLMQAAQGLQYLHTQNPPVVHGDLKGARSGPFHLILLTLTRCEACIADFGLSEVLEQVAAVETAEDSGNSTAWQVAGHPRWQSPELLRAVSAEEARRTTQSDIFAFGRVIIELLTGDLPFAEIANNIAVVAMVISGTLPERPKDAGVIARGLDDRMWGLVKECCETRPDKRPSAEYVLNRLRAALESRKSSNGFGLRLRSFFTR
ncbi:hypothetical protein BOTBODRAFT_119839 [Botryobasidium botryosum FD-172 SS1]|uniref:Protein kinase domain-containing protein n=1 Tax=Botryobasidium botryosum (strain FD-172 SS1) TaxID=930990 RepID=A0A067LZ08_BOTB1|nr:hypothetical protein BOTBODRAFT_119839 [Botryobasidium botryosum FD-172 SS1]